jgi:hypothetical protein
MIQIMLPCMEEPIVNNEMERIYKKVVITKLESICLDRVKGN